MELSLSIYTVQPVSTCMCILNLEYMNVCLLGKCLYKFGSEDATHVLQKILSSQTLSRAEEGPRHSQFWNSLMGFKDLLFPFYTRKIGIPPDSWRICRWEWFFSSGCPYTPYEAMNSKVKKSETLQRQLDSVDWFRTSCTY